MQLGAFQLHTISGGRFRLDGGAMFGIVPKPLWNRVCEADDRNRILLDTNCVLVETGRQRLLIDTGYGTKLSAKQREIHAAEGPSLVDNLAAHGVPVTDIDVVVFSHLHFDHAGGATRLDEQGAIQPTFPNARYVAQRLEWEASLSDAAEWMGTYPEALDCLKPQLQLLDGDATIVEGVRAILTGGHAPGHQAVVIESDGQAAVYLGDLCPTWHHLPTMWSMAYDYCQLELRRVKPRLLRRIAGGNWWALSDHDPDYAAVRLQQDAKQQFQIVDPQVKL